MSIEITKDNSIAGDQQRGDGWSVAAGTAAVRWNVDVDYGNVTDPYGLRFDVSISQLQIYCFELYAVLD